MTGKPLGLHNFHDVVCIHTWWSSETDGHEYETYCGVGWVASG